MWSKSDDKTTTKHNYDPERTLVHTHTTKNTFTRKKFSFFSGRKSISLLKPFRKAYKIILSKSKEKQTLK